MSSERHIEKDKEQQESETRKIGEEMNYERLRGEYLAMGCSEEWTERFIALIKRMDASVAEAAESARRAETRARELIPRGVIHYPRPR